MAPTPTTGDTSDPEARRDAATGVHGTIVLAIGEDIVRGEIKPGERLPREAELIARFQASRTAIREAMKVLTAKGLVQARQRAGTKVRPRAEWDLLDADVLSWHDPDTIGDTLVGDLVELRQFLEPKAARLAAERATEDDIEAMRAAYECMTRAAADPGDFYAADIAFHLAVFTGCHNLLIQRLSGIVETVLTLSFKLQGPGLVDLHEAIEAHGRVIDRIRDRDRAGAERAMRAVIGRAKVELRRRRTRIATAARGLRP
jgi:DNA-binding FadR family transcriptional regulator